MIQGERDLLRSALGERESRGDYYNDNGQYWGKYQFGEARRKDIEQMIGLHHLTRDEFTPQTQEMFFDYHVNDLEAKLIRDGLTKYFGENVIGKSNGVVAAINKCGIIAGAHLGGYEGVKKFLADHDNDRADSLGTYISDYVAYFSDITEKKTSAQTLPGSISNSTQQQLFSELFSELFSFADDIVKFFEAYKNTLRERAKKEGIEFK